MASSAADIMMAPQPGATGELKTSSLEECSRRVKNVTDSIPLSNDPVKQQ